MYTIVHCEQKPEPNFPQEVIKQHRKNEQEERVKLDLLQDLKFTNPRLYKLRKRLYEKAKQNQHDYVQAYLQKTKQEEVN